MIFDRKSRLSWECDTQKEDEAGGRHEVTCFEDEAAVFYGKVIADYGKRTILCV